MKNNFIKKIMALSIISISLLGICSIGASAEWRKSNNNWYYYDSNNHMQSNSWMKDANGKYYYFNSDGTMAHDTVINGYQLSSDGAWVNITPLDSNENINQNENTGWQNINNQKYYIKADGTKVTGWLKDLDDKWYYFKVDGVMLYSSWLNDGGKWHYLDSYGVVVSNTTIDGHRIGSDGILIGNNSPLSNKNVSISGTKTNTDINNSNEQILLDKLKEEKDLWEKETDNVYKKGKIKELQDRIDGIEKDSAYEKMNTSEQRASLIADKQAEISKLENELEQWKKEDSIYSKKQQYDIQHEIDLAQKYINAIS